MGVNDAYNSFISIVTFNHDTCFPHVKMSRKKSKNKPWITESIRHKNIMFRRYISKPTLDRKTKLSKYRCILNKVISHSKLSYYKRILQTRQHFARHTWAVLDELLNKKGNSVTKVPKIMYSNKTITNDIEIANAFNDYFSTIGNKLSNDISCDTDPTEFMHPGITNTIFLSPITYDEVLKEINSLNDGKLPGIDGIPPKVWTSVSHVIAPVLCHLFNLVLTTGIYPDALKVAKVIPIFKKGDSTLPENYRPISLLPCINKLLERSIEKRLRSFLNSNNILFDFQFGFRKHHDTSHALLETVNCIRNYLDNGENALGLYLDLKKAFDTVNHTILLDKLKNYGIRGNAFEIMHSYLSHRKQFLYVNGIYSTCSYVNVGVPQGSVLGPLLFLIYVNDIKIVVPNESLRLFADDTNVFVHDSNCTILVHKAHSVLKQLKTWFDANRLTLHLGKTNFSIFMPIAIFPMLVQTTLL